MRYLTKSRFKTGLECPNKLFYTKKEEYANQKDFDPFLEALASGGFQVEELARLHYPDGVLIEDQSHEHYDYEAKVNETSDLLAHHENIVIFEAAFKFNNLFIRVDILEKKATHINLIEVKAKSFNSIDDQYEFVGKKGGMVSGWKYYLFDVAFQKYVVNKAYPEYRVTPYLMLADKDKTANVDGLNQMFRIKKSANNRTGIDKIESELNKLNFPEDSVLSQRNVTDVVADIESGKHRILEEYAFKDAIHIFAKAYQEDRYLGYDLDFSACKKCEFYTDDNTKDKKSGLQECFKKQLGWQKEDFEVPNAFEIWDFRRWKELNKLQKLKLTDIDDELFGNQKNKGSKMSRVTRQLTQKHKSIEQDNTPEIYKSELRNEIESWDFPLNFIDFEASVMALPFYEGQSPYEKVVFQFSHHIYHENGLIEHANEFINVNPGEFPNFEFIRALKSALSQNQGTIFQFSPYENSTLNQVKRQLEASQEPDKNELLDFMKSIAVPPKDKNYPGEAWEPDRPMVDLCRVIKDYYYNPLTKGSNSIKAILPAILESCPYIQKKYTQSIGQIGLTSKNFSANHVWLSMSNGNVVDPYQNLDKPFEDWDPEFERKSDIEEINNGGAALTAYGLTQYSDMTSPERNAIKNALLKYCELDTLAMVMVYEHLKFVAE
jgi:hypothetical protein